jgi:hypothetical protein
VVASVLPFEVEGGDHLESIRWQNHDRASRTLAWMVTGFATTMQTSLSGIFLGFSVQLCFSPLRSFIDLSTVRVLSRVTSRLKNRSMNQSTATLSFFSNVGRFPK